MLTQQRLQEVLHYDPGLGLFWWNERPENTPMDVRFNRHKAGKLAGTLDSSGYAQVVIDGKPYAQHRLAWLYMTGSHPVDQIDHKNTWKLDNAFDNLREATRSQNAANRGKRSDNTTGFKGVVRKGKRFTAYFSKDGDRRSVGTYDTPEEANAAYAARSQETHGEYSRHN